ncbi:MULTISPECIES: hypothetical protein [unclassified Curtobacterium]|jgi:hypothetical protein|uniref:hypothetical protein n=1 Tax=unclassified Curtobacterium TaxID=257496 RepID=UPI002864AB50|nr:MULTISPECIES: hypothetical protein [unclassified Curtobacterium]MDR6172425.1 hypothetical protein [Curtobacterium sp. SORGH_AS_0776]MDR6571711.1 hypothetical protein [Curtobacterium sp. 320]
MSSHDETFAAIEAAVVAVPGVAELYRARPTLGSAVGAAKNLATRTAVARVVLDDDVLRIVIGTDGSVPAPETARAAHLAALAAATEHGLPLSRVDVRIARVG